MKEEDVKLALSAVHDPHIPVSIERMGMLKSINIDLSGHVRIELVIPCLACPGVSMLKQEIVDAVSAIKGVTSVNVDEGWHHEWNTEMIVPEARIFMQRYGIRT